MKRCIVLGDGRRVPLGAYVAAWKIVKAAPPGQRFNRSLEERYSASAAEILGQYRKGLHDRINKHLPGYRVGRKWSEDYQCDLWQAQSRLSIPRLVIDWLPADLKGRFHHRLREAA